MVRELRKFKVRFVEKMGHGMLAYELAVRGHCLLIPEIATGDDMFTMNDKTGLLQRVHVKVSMFARSRKTGGDLHSFASRMNIITRPKKPDIIFVFAMNSVSEWNYLIMPRKALHDNVKKGMGALASDSETLMINIRLRPNNGIIHATCGDFSLTRYLNNWQWWT